MIAVTEYRDRDDEARCACNNPVPWAYVCPVGHSVCDRCDRCIEGTAP